MVGAEVLVERGHVEVGERARVRETVDVAGFEPGVHDRFLGRLGTDLLRGAARRLGVRGLADPGDGHLAGDVVELARATPVPLPWHAGTIATSRAGPPRADPLPPRPVRG